MLLPSILLIIGLLLLIKGGDLLVTGSSSIARNYGISELVIGLTIVAFGTSAPELIVSVLAAIDNHPEIALGNVIGSNNFNLLIVLGLSGILAPITVQVVTIRKEIPMSMGAAFLLLLLANDSFIGSGENVLGRIDGFILIAFFSGFLFYIWRSMKSGVVPEVQTGIVLSKWKSVLFITLGLAALIGGGKLVVTSAVDLARMFNVSEKVIGLTIVAIGTSLPELVTSLVAMRKGKSDIAIGNVIGSNIFNIFLILGVGALIQPMNYAIQFNQDLLLLIFSTMLLILAMFTGSRRRLDRWESLVFVGIYVAYMVYVGIRN
jgi:cation:H+ antiporter